MALCDVDQARAANTFKKHDVAKYKDFRVMLEKEGKNIDACTIAVPDFMHATIALACMQQGKHVYVEKPLTRTPWEARLLQDAAVKYKVATQMGNQGFSHEAHRVAAEIVWSGEIGDVTEAHVSTSPGMFPTGLQAAAAGIGDSRDARLGPVARRRGRAPLQRRLRAVQLARLPRLRHRPDRQLGDAHRGPGAHRAAARRPRERRVHSASRARAASRCRIARVVRLDFPARGGMPPVSVYYHESARPGDPEAFVVPGMENETILPPSNNLARQGPPDQQPRPRARRSPAGAGRAASPRRRRPLRRTRASGALADPTSGSTPSPVGATTRRSRAC